MEIPRPLQKITSLFLALSLSMVSVASAFAIGVSPSTVRVENVLSGSSVPTEIVITRADGSGSAMVTLTVGGASGEYVTLPEGETMTFPEGEQRLTVPLLVEAGNLAGGEYEATFTVTMTSGVDEAGGTGTSLMGASQAKVLFSVTNDAVEAYEITSADMSASEVGEPIGFTYVMDNTGNVDTRPARVELEMVDETDDDNVLTQEFSGEEIAIVPAFTREEVSMFIEDHDLTPALYATSVTFYDADDEVIYEMDTLRVQIFPQGTLSQEAKMNSFNIEKGSYIPGETVRMSADFENTGSIGVEASFVVEVFLNGSRVDELKQDAVFVPAGRQTEFEYDFVPTEEGEYSAAAYVKYGIYKTEVMDGTFSVALEGGYAMFFAILMVIIGLILAIVTFITSRRSSKNAAPVAAVVQAKAEAPVAPAQPAVEPSVEPVAPAAPPVEPAAPSPEVNPTPPAAPEEPPADPQA